MKILHRYILRLLIRNLLLAAIGLTMLFLLFDFLDRIDNMIANGAPVGKIATYFVLKIPQTMNLMLPVATLVATMFTFGLLSRSSEVTAMRASGISIFWIAKPLFLVGLCLSLFSIALNETVVPYTARRVREIYNIDIRQKTRTGSYSQSNFWWRGGKTFYSADIFDSRTNTLLNISSFDVGDDFSVKKRTDAAKASFVDSDLGWSMSGVAEYRFSADEAGSVEPNRPGTLPLPIKDQPSDFYDVKADRNSMSFRELRTFIAKQRKNGRAVSGYYADLYEKMSFPFVCLLSTIVALPFALKPARTGSMAQSMIAGLAIGFIYYVVHYFSIALGRAELWPPLLAAWMANILMGVIGCILNLGAESPS